MSEPHVAALSQAEFVVVAESAAKQALLAGEEATSEGLLAALKERSDEWQQHQDIRDPAPQ